MISTSNIIIYSLIAQSFNLSFWKCFKVGGLILVTTGFFQWRLVMDHLRERFLIFCTIIGLIVVCYSTYYMVKSETNIFRSIIFLFITSILILTARSNIITMFIGWEGVGAISFILIGWFISREKAISSSFYAFIYNRFADFFFLLLVLWEICGQHRLFYLQLIRDGLLYSNASCGGMLSMIWISFWVATAGKSAQFVFHPWLTLAIEGPTPVRRLLHRSTMVVAGVYLLLKLHPLIISLNWLDLNNVIILSRVVTIIFSSLWAINQIDIKKIIALSTTSQLSLMIVVCCIGQYDLAFLHIVLHGFFKALLFLGRGIAIHNKLTNRQDITKINLLKKGPTFLHTVFIIGVLGLIGAPFIGSFQSKHLILDLTQYVTTLSSYDVHINQYFGYTRTLAYIGLYMSPVITLGYSIKLISFISQNPSITVLSSSYIGGSSDDLKVVVPISLLAIFRFVVGLSVRQLMRGGMSSSTSHEDVYYSLFLFVLFLGLFYYILLIQSSLIYSYNKSASILKSSILYMRNLIMVSFFHLVEYLTFKKGLKLTIPSPSADEKYNSSLSCNSNLEISLITYLFNLAMTILYTGFVFTILLTH